MMAFAPDAEKQPPRHQGNEHLAETVEKSPDSPLSSTSCENVEDVEYLYLEFDTELATTPVFANRTMVGFPACPDLRKYTNPFTWSNRRKNLMTWVSCATNAAAAYAAGSYAAPEMQLTERWNISDVAYSAGISIFVFGFAIAPLFLAPFSEINGRRPVFIASGVLFVICQLGCALTDSFAGMLVARFFAGVGGSTFSTMVGGVLADIWVTAERNTPMVLFTGFTLFGTGLGPVISGVVAQRLLWRWVFYLQVILAGVLVGLVAVFFKETRGPIILSRKAKALNKWYEKLEAKGCIGMELPDNSSEPRSQSPKVRRVRYKVLAVEQRASVWQMISLTLTRSAQLLLTEPILVCFSLWISLTWAVLYLQFSSVPLVFTTNHDFTIEENGAVFTAVCVGGIVSTILNIYLNNWAVKRFGERYTKNPEGRLWFTCAQGLCFPVGLFWFGWTCYRSIHWIVPTVALFFMTIGIFSVFLATFNYTADVYRTYASSALAAAGVCRNCLAAVFPPITVRMFRTMGFQAANSLLGGVALLLTLGPILLIWFGPRIRLRSKVAKEFISRDET